jgi:hypothetical protein
MLTRNVNKLHKKERYDMVEEEGTITCGESLCYDDLCISPGRGKDHYDAQFENREDAYYCHSNDGH